MADPSAPSLSAPWLLDLCCCEGAAAKGYYDAGFNIVGVDTVSKYGKRYPYQFVCGDALYVLDTMIGDLEYGIEPGFAAVHASPPCQHASAGTRASEDRSKYPRLIEPIRERLEVLGLPYVIENVAGSALRDPLVLCGTMFGLTAIDDDGTPLEMWRHRHFESNVPLEAPGPCRHHAYSRQVAGSYGGARRDKVEAREERHGGYVPAKAVQERLLGVDWMTQYGLYQSVPPIYTEHIGRQLMAAVNERSGRVAA